MYTLILVFWTWPLWVSIIATVSVSDTLDRPLIFWCKTFAVCVGIEFLLVSGWLQVVVIPLLDMVGFAVHVAVGSAACWLLYRKEKMRMATLR